MSIQQQVNRARALSVQQRARDTTLSYSDRSGLSFLVRAGELIAPWWSPRRDEDLRRFWKTSDHLAGAVHAITSKISTMKFKVIPKDKTVRLQQGMASTAADMLYHAAELGEGWEAFAGKWTEDLVVSDNGAFAEVIGPGDPAGPLTGAAVTIAHLDSGRCTRTSSAEYPVVYLDRGGKRHKLHYTRVLSAAQQSSPRVDMNNVGFSAVSRSINVAQNLIDIFRYKQEKLGSRPPRILAIGKKNISAYEILNAFQVAEEMMDNRNFSRYSQIVAIAPRRGRGEIDIDIKDLASIPDGFDEQTAVTLAMFTIALAFGVDARELWPATISGATKADAMIMHLKARRKGTGLILSTLARQINQKVLPNTLWFEFDPQDDEEDMLRADIREQRSLRRERDLISGVTTVRTEREAMLDKGEITVAQFEAMELAEGRLRDGAHVFTLFYSQDVDMQQLLPLDLDSLPSVAIISSAQRTNVLSKAAHAIMQVHRTMSNATLHSQRRKCHQALAALRYLYQEYDEEKLVASSPAPVGRGRQPNESPEYSGESVRDVVSRL